MRRTNVIGSINPIVWNLHFVLWRCIILVPSKVALKSTHVQKETIGVRAIRRNHELFLLFRRDELSRTGWHFFAMNWFLDLFQKLRYVYVNAPADHNPRLGSVFSRRIDPEFNSYPVWRRFLQSQQLHRVSSGSHIEHRRSGQDRYIHGCDLGL